MEGSSFTPVELCQDGEALICLTTTEGGMEEMSGQDFNFEEMQSNEEDRLTFKIFPDPVEVVLGPESSLPCLQEKVKERLPSIVVEPTELSEVESGELRWPPQSVDLEADEEDLFLEQCIPPANIADWGEEEDEEEKTSVILNHQQNTSLIDLQSDAFRDDTPTLPPSTAPALN